jgi:hypothetical protein
MWWDGSDDDSTDATRLMPDAEWAIIRRGESGPRHDEGPHIGERRGTAPLRDSPALFREFASLDPTDRDAILAFANTHGMLGRPVSFWFDPPPLGYLDALAADRRGPMRDYLAGRGPYPRDAAREAETAAFLDALEAFREGRGPCPAKPPPWMHLHPTLMFRTQVSVAELHSTWVGAIRELREAVNLWDLIAERDADGLGRMVVCEPGYLTKKNKAGRVVASASPRPSWRWYLMRPGEDDHFLHETFNSPTPEVLFRVVTWYVQLQVNSALWRRVQPQLVTDPGSGRVVMQFFPDDLLTALWFQFSQAIIGNKGYRVCRTCGHWFEVSAEDDARTARRVFCSDPCKSRDYRRRKDRAVELRAEGLRPEKIAERLKAEGLETDAATVRKWVGKKRKGG